MNPIPAFANHLPVKIRFGDGIAASLPAVLDEVGASTVFLMVDEGIEVHNPAAAALLAGLAARPDLVVTRFDKPASEPTIDMVDQATAALRGSGAGAVVALGGGSVIDTAKAARLCAQLALTFREFLADRPRLPRRRDPAHRHPHQRGHRLGGVRWRRRLRSGGRRARRASPTPTCERRSPSSIRCSPTACRRR